MYISKKYFHISKNYTIVLCTIFLSIIFGQTGNIIDLKDIDQQWVIEKADKYLSEIPLTITEYTCERSSGGLHDFYSEGDYWWPNVEDIDGPYIRKDGMSNPDNFDHHRRLMVRLSLQVPVLVSAYKITGDKKYSRHAVSHLKAWFINKKTRMNPSLNYGQAIKGRVTGRGVGIIDTIHLVEVAQAIKVLEKMNAIDNNDLNVIKNWFNSYLEWMTTHAYGLDEMNRTNNHGTCWVMQVSMFASLTGNGELVDMSVNRFKEVLVPNQIAIDGSFPLELARTKPYGYSLFNLDAFGIVCQILSNEGHDLWKFKTQNSGSVENAMQYMYPFINDKSNWPLPDDVMYFDKFPVRHPSLLFAGMALEKEKYIDLWKQLDPDPKTKEVLRNFPVRQPVLWTE